MHLTKSQNTRTYLFYLIGHGNCYPTSYERLNAGDKRQEGETSEAGSIERFSLLSFLSEFLIGIKTWCQLQIISGNWERLSAVSSQETGIWVEPQNSQVFSYNLGAVFLFPIKDNIALPNLWYWHSETLSMETVDLYVFDIWFTLAYTCIYTSQCRFKDCVSVMATIATPNCDYSR